MLLGIPDFVGIKLMCNLSTLLHIKKPVFNCVPEEGCNVSVSETCLINFAMLCLSH